MKGAWLGALTLLAGCSPPTKPAPTVTKFQFAAANFAMRPGGCALAGILFEGSEGLEITLSTDGPGKVVDESGLTGARQFYLCASLTRGTGKVRARITGREDLVTATYDVALPSKGLPTWTQPYRVWGRAGPVPTSLSWSADATTIYLGTEAGVLTEWDSAALQPKRTWVGLGEYSKVVSPTRVVTDGVAAIVFDLEQNKPVTWVAGVTGRFSVPSIDVPAVTQVRGVTGFGSVVMIADFSPENCSVGEVDLPEGKHTVWGDAPFGADGAYDHSRAYFDVSPNGRYLAWTGAIGCSVPLSVSSGQPRMLDRTTGRVFECGMTDSDLRPANRTGSSFSGDGSIYAWTTYADVNLRSVPDCTDLGRGVDLMRNHQQVAMSPDGTHLGYITDLTTPMGVLPEVRHIDITPSSPMRHAPDFEGATLTLGGTPQVRLRPTPIEDFWSRQHHMLTYSPDGKRIAVAHLGGGLSIVDLEAGTARTDTQAPYVHNLSLRRVSPNGQWLALSTGAEFVVIALSDGHVVYRTADNEILQDALDTGFVLGFGNSFELVDYATLARTPTAYTEAMIDRTSTPNHRTCQARGAPNRICVLDSAFAEVSCLPYDSTAIPSPPGTPTMLDDDRCFFTSLGALYQYTASTHVLTALAPDPAGQNAQLFHGSTTRELISVGTQTSVWRLP